MKKVISVVLSFILLLAATGVPVVADAISYDVTKTSAAVITATEYSSSYDFSEDSTEIKVEGGNISFNYNDYVEYVLNVEADGLYTIGISSSTTEGNIPVLDLMIDGKTEYRESFPGLGFETTTTVNSYVSMTAGTHTLRIYNVNGGMYLKKVVVTYKKDILNLGDENISATSYVDGLSKSNAKGAYISFAAECQKSGVYKLNLTASRRTSASLYIYTDNTLNEIVSVPSGLKAEEVPFFLNLKEGMNIVKMKVVSGSLYPTKLDIQYICDVNEETEDIAKSADNIKSSAGIYKLIKDNKDVLGIDIDSVTSSLAFPEFVFVRLSNRTYIGIKDFVSSIHSAVLAETKAPSLLTTVSGTTVTVKAKTDIYKENGVFAAALYEGSRLKSLNYAPYTKGTDVSFSVSGYSEGAKIKFFAFDSIDKINPNDLSNGISKEIYVSENGSDETGDGSKDAPFKTIKKAKEKTASLTSSMTGDITVNIAPGYYELSETEVFNESHGGNGDYKVIYKGSDEEQKPVISGGREVTGWQEGENGIYFAELGGTQVRDLFVGGYPAKRARSKYTYEDWTYSDETTMVASKYGMPESFSHPEDLVFVWTLYWATQYTPVLSMTDNGDTFTFKMDDIFKEYVGTSNIRIEEKKRFYMENALEFLDSPGEFYHDSHNGIIYYKPYPEEDMTKIETFVSNLDKIIEVSGESKDAKIKNLVFDNLSFRYGTRNKNSMMQIQADQHYEGGVEMKIPSQFSVNYADGISVKNCEFSCLGSGAVEFFDGVTNSEVRGNLIKDIGGTGISVGNFTRPRTDDEGNMCSNITVSDNVLRRTSNVYRGTTAIAVYYENNIDIVHNDIEDLPYTGITAGWGWGTARERFGNINISNNRIHNVIKTLTDGGHIYTLGNMPGSVISENYMTKSGDYRGGIYTDSGSQNISIIKNVCDNSSLWWHVGLYYTKNMTADGNFSPRQAINDSGENIVVKNHTEVSDGNFDAVASDIINKAGVREEYKYLLENTEAPSYREDSFVIPLDTYKDTQEVWIEAEDFNPGLGTGYYPKNFNEPYNNIYRPEGLNLYRNFLTNKGYYIHRVAQGDWMAYTVNVPENGTYFFDLKAANGYDDSYNTILDVFVDGNLALDNVKFPSTGEWYRFTPVRMGKINLTKGTHTIKLLYAGSGFHIDAFRLQQAENIRISMADHKTAYCALKNTDSLYIEGGNTTWHINDWAEYEVKINQPGKYTFGMEFGSSVGSGLRNVVKINGTEVLSALKLSQGTYTDRKDVDFGTVTFDKAGTYTVRIENTGGNGGHYTGDIYFVYTE